MVVVFGCDCWVDKSVKTDDVCCVANGNGGFPITFPLNVFCVRIDSSELDFSMSTDLSRSSSLFNYISQINYFFII